MSSLDLISGGRKCFGKHKCWTQIKNKCPVQAACKLKAQAEQIKLDRDKQKAKP